MSEGIGTAVRSGVGPRRSFLGTPPERTASQRRMTELTKEAP